MINTSEDYVRGLSGKHPKYDQDQTLGSYRTSETPFSNPEEIHVFEGFGANKADLERGWCEAEVKELPNYDKANYHDRWSQPMLPDEDQGNRMFMNQDMEFRMKERESKGFLTRPRIPTER